MIVFLYQGTIPVCVFFSLSGVIFCISVYVAVSIVVVVVVDWGRGGGGVVDLSGVAAIS